MMIDWSWGCANKNGMLIANSEILSYYYYAERIMRIVDRQAKFLIIEMKFQTLCFDSLNTEVDMNLGGNDNCFKVEEETMHDKFSFIIKRLRIENADKTKVAISWWGYLWELEIDLKTNNENIQWLN